MTNQQFCYWLQGYFEIALSADLPEKKVRSIAECLKNIDEMPDQFTQWLRDVIGFLSSQDYRQTLLDFFLPEIKDRLNLVFYHVIDHSYDVTMTREAIRKIHDGDG